MKNFKNTRKKGKYYTINKNKTELQITISNVKLRKFGKVCPDKIRKYKKTEEY